MQKKQYAHFAPFSLILFMLVIFFSCGKNVDKLPLATFDGGNVTIKEYVDHFLLSTKYKPKVMPTRKNLEEIVFNKAMEKIAELEARARGYDQDSTLLQQLSDRLDAMLFQRYMRTEIIDKVITDSLVQEFYKNFSPQYKMRYILRAVPENAPPKLVATQKDTIQLIYQWLNEGKDFAELAKKYSQDLLSAPKGGDLGYLIRESMGDAKLREVMDALPEKSYSKPVRGVAGYYILYKGEKRVVPVPPLDEVRGRIWQTLYRTRRHDIEKVVDKRFRQLVPVYHYKVDSAVVRAIFEKTGAGKDLHNDIKTIDPDKLTEQDFDLVLASYDGGQITVKDVFADRKKRPEDVWEFWKRMDFLAQQKLFARDARQKGYDKLPEFDQEREAIFKALLREKIIQQEIKNYVQTKLDSVRKVQVENLSPEDLKLFLVKKRTELENKYRSAFENKMKKKYHFQYVTENFATALSVAKKRKQEYVKQNEKQKQATKKPAKK